jgi:hypothetical protein
MAPASRSFFTMYASFFTGVPTVWEKNLQIFHVPSRITDNDIQRANDPAVVGIPKASSVHTLSLSVEESA